MKIIASGFIVLLVFFLPAVAFAVEAVGTGSMIPGPLINVWSEAYSLRSPASSIKFKGSNPADGIKRLINKEVDFSSIDMPLSAKELDKSGLFQFPFALSAVAPVVNLPGVYPGQFKFDGNLLAEIFLGNIKKWNDPAIVALNPGLRLPDEEIIIVHRASPPGISTIIGDYLAKNSPQWKTVKGDGMAGSWPANSIEVKNPPENLEKLKNTKYAIGYGPIAHIMKHGLAYAQLKNKAGNYISPSDANISAAAENAKWDESNGFDIVITDQPGPSSWPLSMASFALVRKVSEQPERTKEVLKYFKYSLRYGDLKAVQQDFIPLPDSVSEVVQASWNNITDNKGKPVIKD